MGTPWMTQRGLKEADMVQVADIIADVLKATTPYSVETRQGPAQRAKVDFAIFETAKIARAQPGRKSRYRLRARQARLPALLLYRRSPIPAGQIALRASRCQLSRSFANYAFSSDVAALQPGESQKTCLITPQGAIEGVLTCVDLHAYRLTVPGAKAGLAAAWLRDLSDGYITL